MRHAEPQRILASQNGPADPPLTDRGRDEAARLAAWLGAEAIDHVVSSPMRRAVETAAPVASAHAHDVEIVADLAEYDADSTTYIPIEELAKSGAPEYRAMVEGRWDELGYGLDPAAFQARVVAVVESIIGRFPGQRVVAVCHGGVINAYLGHVLGIERLLWFHPAYASISRVAASRQGARSVVTLNETAHLLESLRLETT